MPFSGQLWYLTEGGDADTRLARVDDDSTASTTVVSNGGPGTGDDNFVSSFFGDLGVDTATGFYFAIVSNTNNTNATLVRGSINGGAPTTVATFTASYIVNTIELDAVNRKIYVGVQNGSGVNAATTGIKVYSYDAAGALTDLGFLTTAASDNRANVGGLALLDPQDFALDQTVVAGGRLFYTERLTNNSVGLFRLDLNNPDVATNMIAAGTFPTNGSNGFLMDVEVDETNHKVYFTTRSVTASGGGSYDANDNAVWWIDASASGGTPTKVTLNGMPSSIYFGGDMTFDQSTRQIYIESEESFSVDTDDVIYVFQLDASGTSATYVRSISPSPAFAGVASIEGMAFADLAALTVNGSGAVATEQSATAVPLLSGVPTITDTDGGYLVGATVQITGGTFSANENSTADDHLGFGAAKQISGTIAGTSITVSWNAATETLTLSGYDTLANYQAALAGLVYWTTGDNPTNYGANASRTLTWTINDGTPGSLAGTVSTATSTINIAAVNDAPVNGGPVTASGAEDSDIAVTGLSISDVDADPASATMTVTLSVTHGVLTLLDNVAGGLTAGDIAGNGSGSVTVTGTINAINATLAASNGLVYHGDQDVSGTDTLTVVTNDGGATGSSGALSDTDSYTITIAATNDPHTGGVSITGAATEDQVLTANTSTLADADGLGALHYQWQRDSGSGFVNVGLDQATYTLGDADVGAVVRVIASYTDGQGFAETATSAPTGAIVAVDDAPTGGVSITGAATEDQVLTADTSTLADADGLGALHYQWQRDTGSGFVNVGLDQATYTLGDADVGAVVRVVASYTDGQGFTDAVTSAPTSAVAAVNDPHTGGVSITGAATEDQVLTADTSTLADADGLGTLHYQWQRDSGSGFVNVGLDQATYTLGDADVGAVVRVIASYTDGQGFAEAATSASTSAVTSVNDPHTGGVSITGAATEDQVLTANTSTLADADGLGALHYQWQRNSGSGFVNAGLDQATYTLGDADVGAVIRVVASYTDGQGYAETATSAQTGAVAPVDDAPTGGVSITGAATEDQVLTANTSTLADADGLGALHYQWQRNSGSGFVNVGTDQATYTLGDADVGAVVRVVASYTDGQGFTDAVTSASTGAVANVNDAPTGGASINGSPTQNQVLTANTSTLADADGLGTLHYQWQRDTGSGFVNVGTDQATYTLGAADVGGVVRVTASYVDGHGTAEAVTSAATAPIASSGPPNQHLVGTPGLDFLIGGLGNDVIEGLGFTDLLVGGGGSDTFVFGPHPTGVDLITDFGGDDVILTKSKLQDSNNDGIVPLHNGVLDLGGLDAVAFLGGPDHGVRYLGVTADGLYAYGDADTRPKNAIEGKLSNDNLAGDTGDHKANVFFFDTDLALNWGVDHITRFGAKDILVTTTALADPNHDNLIVAGPGSIFGFTPPSNSPAGTFNGSVTVANTSGAAVSTLEFDGMVSHDGVDYYIYSLLGSSGGVGTILF